MRLVLHLLYLILHTGIYFPGYKGQSLIYRLFLRVAIMYLLQDKEGRLLDLLDDLPLGESTLHNSDRGYSREAQTGHLLVKQFINHLSHKLGIVLIADLFRDVKAGLEVETLFNMQVELYTFESKL